VSRNTFVLVHGAWHGAWCYERVRQRLTDQGARVIVPTLTGLCERSHLYSPAINLTTHVLDVVNLIRWHDLLSAPAARAQLESATAANGYGIPPIPAAIFNVNPADREWVDRSCTPQPLATFTERVRLSGRVNTVKRNTYVLATDLPGSEFGRFRDARVGLAQWRTHELSCGHDVMIDMPEQTAKILQAA